MWYNPVRKALALILMIVMCAALPGCEGDTAADMGMEITGNIYDTGEFQTLIPAGWAAFPIPDVFADDPNAVKTSCFHIIKDGVSEGDIHAKPYIRLDCLEPGVQITDPDPVFYKNIEDVGPLDLGGHSWSGYVCEDCFGGYRKPVIGRIAVLWTEADSIRYEALIRLEFNGQKEKISLEDRDVQAILASVTRSEAQFE